jgi:hypothetical protein
MIEPHSSVPWTDREAQHRSAGGWRKENPAKFGQTLMQVRTNAVEYVALSEMDASARHYRQIMVAFRDG